MVEAIVKIKSLLVDLVSEKVFLVVSKYIKESERIIKTTVIIVVLKKLSLINRNELFSRDLTYFNKQMTRLVQTNVHSLELFHFPMQHN